MTCGTCGKRIGGVEGGIPQREIKTDDSGTYYVLCPYCGHKNTWPVEDALNGRR